MPDIQTILFEFYLSAYFSELCLESFSVSLGEAFLNDAGSAVYHFLGFLEAEAGNFFHELNDFEFLSASGLEDYVEGGLFLNSCTCSGGTSCNSYSSSGGFDAVFVLEDLSEFVNFLDSEVYELFSKSF